MRHALALGPRHFDPTMREHINTHVNAGWTTHREWRTSEQGFIDQWGTFLTREEALAVALAAGQRVRRCGGDETRLYSENLY